MNTTGHAIDATVAQLAGALQEGDDLDALYVVQLLASLIAPPIHAELCRVMEICPTHLRDPEICTDDASDCEAGQLGRETARAAMYDAPQRLGTITNVTMHPDGLHIEGHRD